MQFFPNPFPKKGTGSGPQNIQIYVCPSSDSTCNREEKLLHHVAMVAKFPDDNKSKVTWKVDLRCFKLHWSYLICQALAKFCGLNPKGPYLGWENEKETFCVVLTYSIKWAREIRKCHVTVMQQQLRNAQKSMMHMQSCFFANVNLLFFCCSPSPLQKLPIVVIQKFWNHGNVTSHFSPLFVKQNSLLLPPPLRKKSSWAMEKIHLDFLKEMHLNLQYIQCIQVQWNFWFYVFQLVLEFLYWLGSSLTLVVL